VLFGLVFVAQVFRPAHPTAGLKTRATTATPAPTARAQSLPADVSRLQLRVGIARAGGYAVTPIPLETYVARVLAGEAARDSPPAALEALAITVRTFALANRGRHRADGFDLCDQTHCQVFRAATAVTERAAAATAGLVLLRGGVPASIYYSASCGGQTEIPSAVWPGAEDPPFLPSRPDDACGGGPVWTAEIGGLDLVRAFRAAGFRGDLLRDLRIVARDGSGRVARLRIDGLEPAEISGQDLRVVIGRTLGWQRILSAAFEVRRVGNAFQFAGHGAGHGVGLCVIGSVGLAAAGKNAADILDRYFPGLEIGSPDSSAAVSAPEVPRAAGARPGPRVGPATSAGAPDVLVSLPDEDEGEQARIVDLTRRARDELARQLDITAPAPITLRFHPTTDSYERATGQAWFTAGVVANGELHLLPLTTLRDRGVLERTIRHALVRVMTDTALARRPFWVREGAAIYFADGGRGAPGVKGDRSIPSEADAPTFRPQPRESCPSDLELLRPVSAGALTNAYARARACFARQIAAGRTWRDVR
jgi:SpoIID/LytB domain protein